MQKTGTDNFLRPAKESHLSLLSSSRSSHSGAFTLVEILIVVVVVGTVAAAAAPTLSETLRHMKATALAREIAMDMRYAQMLAVRTGIRHRVAFSTSSKYYTVGRWTGSGWARCQHPVTKKEWRADLTQYSRYSGLTITSAAFGSSPHVYWNPSGAPDAGGAVSFTLGGVTRTIRVAPLSGRITVE